MDGGLTTFRNRNSLDLTTINSLLKGCTVLLLPRRHVAAGVSVQELIMPKDREYDIPLYERVDAAFATVAVNLHKAKAISPIILDAIRPMEDVLRPGASIRHLRDSLGSMDAGLRLMGFGKARGWWKVETPERLFGFKPGTGFFDNACRDGFVRCTPFCFPPPPLRPTGTMTGIGEAEAHMPLDVRAGRD